MAKQNVSFIERHVEKIAVGVAGAILLGVAGYMFVGGPHAVDVAGQSYGPEGLYDEMASAVDRAVQSMSNPGPIDVERPLELPENTGGQTFPTEIAVAAVPLSPPLPDVEGTGMGARNKFELVEILPPTRPVVSTGRASVGLPDVTVIDVGADKEPATSDLPPLTRDWHWVAAFATVSRKAQWKRYIDAGYPVDLLDLVVADIVVERQHRLPNGQWSEPETVEPFLPQRYAYRPQVELVQQDGRFRVAPADESYIESFRQTLAKSEAQKDILRAPFQEYLRATGSQAEDYEEAWSPPEELIARDGTVIDLALQDYGLTFPEEEEEEEDASTGRADARTNPVVWARRAMKSVETALEEGEFLEAEELLNDLVGREGLPRSLTEEAQQLLRTHRPDFDAARRAEARASQKAASDDGVSELGPDVEAMWITDVTVVPGKTYRYRIALEAMNHYAGVPVRLANPEDAARLVLRSDFSDWSDPITVEPDKYLFVTAVKEGRGGTGPVARAEIWQWTLGAWDSGSEELGVGDVVAFAPRNGPMFSYDAVILAIDRDRPYQERDAEGSGDRFGFHDETTHAVVLVNAKGETEERLIAEDIERKQDITKRIREEEQARQERLDGERPRSGRNVRERTPPRRPVGGGGGGARPAGS